MLNIADGAIGYLEDDGENHKIFSVIAKALKNGGKHFMDIMNGSYAQTGNKSSSNLYFFLVGYISVRNEI